jgi:hypothetical protein
VEEEEEEDDDDDDGQQVSSEVTVVRTIDQRLADLQRAQEEVAILSKTPGLMDAMKDVLLRAEIQKQQRRFRGVLELEKKEADRRVREGQATERARLLNKYQDACSAEEWPLRMALEEEAAKVAQARAVAGAVAEAVARAREQMACATASRVRAQTDAHELRWRQRAEAEEAAVVSQAEATAQARRLAQTQAQQLAFAQQQAQQAQQQQAAAAQAHQLEAAAHAQAVADAVAEAVAETEAAAEAIAQDQTANAVAQAVNDAQAKAQQDKERAVANAGRAYQYGEVAKEKAAKRAQTYAVAGAVAEAVAQEQTAAVAAQAQAVANAVAEAVAVAEAAAAAAQAEATAQAQRLAQRQAEQLAAAQQQAQQAQQQQAAAAQAHQLEAAAHAQAVADVQAAVAEAVAAAAADAQAAAAAAVVAAADTDRWRAAALSCDGYAATDDPGHVPQTTPGGCFATSNYKVAYDGVRRAENALEPQHKDRVLFAVRRLVEDFCERLYPGDAVATPLQVAAGRAFVLVLQDEWQLNDDADKASERVWTSLQKLPLVGTPGVGIGREFCSIFSQAIRDDRASVARACAIFARGLRTNLVVSRGGIAGNVRVSGMCPPGGVCWRGGGFNDLFKPFFTDGKKFRVPGFLATSLHEGVTHGFMERAQLAGVPVVQWKIQFDPRGDPLGANLPQWRCKHVNAMRVTHVPGEYEWLFQAHSVFTVKEVQWSAVTPATFLQPHRITLEPALDNALEDEDLEAAPWS